MTTEERVITEEDFLELVEGIQNHTYCYPPDVEGSPEFSHRFAIAKEADPKWYLVNGEPIYDLVNDAIAKLYVDLDDLDREAFCKAIPGYLEKPVVMLEYIEDKQQRDYVIQKIFTTEEGLLLDSSMTRSTNIRSTFTILDVLFPKTTIKEFNNFTKDLSRLYRNQQHHTNDNSRIVAAGTVRLLVYNFCIHLIKKASQ